jgi:3-dehydroquinate dehydratase-1
MSLSTPVTSPPGHALVSRTGPVAGGRLPAICVPLLAPAAAALEAEAREAVVAGADLVEWRVDHFGNPGDVRVVLDAAGRLRATLGGVPLLATLRSPGEGGRDTGLAAAAVVAIQRALAGSGLVDFIDVELSAGAELVALVRAVCQASDTRLIVSSHDFAGTPPVDVMRSRLQRAAALGADVAKLAVMPASARDVLALLEATESAARELPIPVVTMAMGSLGLVTRVFGVSFGSSLTFAAGRMPSAPGQVPARQLREMLDAIADNRGY